MSTSISTSLPVRLLLLLSLVSPLIGVGCGDPASAFDGETPEGTADMPLSETEQSFETAGCSCSLPTSGLYATFQVGTETFNQQITSSVAMSDAIAVWRGRSNKHIPIGSLQCSCVGWNCQHGFGMLPGSVRMAAAAVEVCDGMPSYVDAHCSTFGMGSYCPWSAKLVGLRDCRSSRACPTVLR